MGSQIAGRGPEYEYLFAVHILRGEDRHIGRFNPIAVAANPLLSRIDLLRGESAHRALRNTGLFGNADQ